MHFAFQTRSAASRLRGLYVPVVSITVEAVWGAINVHYHFGAEKIAASVLPA